jgi:hypothetical protein
MTSGPQLGFFVVWERTATPVAAARTRDWARRGSADEPAVFETMRRRGPG